MRHDSALLSLGEPRGPFPQMHWGVLYVHHHIDLVPWPVLRQALFAHSVLLPNTLRHHGLCTGSWDSTAAEWGYLPRQLRICPNRQVGTARARQGWGLGKVQCIRPAAAP